MTISIELEPDQERALLERARRSGRDLGGYVRQVLQAHLQGPSRDVPRGGGHVEAEPLAEDLIDDEAIESCAREVEGKEVPSLEEVRRTLATIPGRMAQVVIEEREERS